MSKPNGYNVSNYNFLRVEDILPNKYYLAYVKFCNMNSATAKEWHKEMVVESDPPYSYLLKCNLYAPTITHLPDVDTAYFQLVSCPFPKPFMINRQDRNGNDVAVEFVTLTNESYSLLLSEDHFTTTTNNMIFGEAFPSVIEIDAALANYINECLNFEVSRITQTQQRLLIDLVTK